MMKSVTKANFSLVPAEFFNKMLNGCKSVI